ncbi:MAG: MFS transporter [Actinobacteria bacterium]|nr:MFS transporter [Actinomycetota bacterium]
MDGTKRLLILVSLVIFVDSLGYGVVVPVMPVYARDLGVGELGLGLLFASYALGNIVAAVPCGLVSDRLGRRPFLAFGMLAMAGAFVLYAYSSTYVALFLSRFLDGVTAAANWSVGLAVIADVYPAGERGHGMGTVMAAMGAGAIAGPALGGALYDSLGYRAPFLVVAAVCALGGILALASRELKRLEASGGKAGFMTATRRVAAYPGMTLVLAVVMMGTVSLGVLEPLFPVHLQGKLGLSSTVIGMLFALTVMVYTLASPLVGWLADRWGKRAFLTSGLLATAVAAPALTLSGNVWVAAALFAACGLTIALFETPTLPLIADLMAGEGGEDVYGVAFGLFNMAWAVGYLLGPVAGGFLAQRYGLPTAMIVLSVPLVALAWKTWERF